MAPRIKLYQAIVLTLVSDVSASEHTSNSLEAIPASWRSSYETLSLPAGDVMGIVGLHYDIQLFKHMPSAYFGIGGYGSAAGDEGGFFTVGATLGMRQTLWEDLTLDLGGHFGAGGGSGATFPGGGMFIRGHAVLEFPLAGYQLRFGLAHTDFANSYRSPHAETHLVAGLRIDTFGWWGGSSTMSTTAPFFSGEVSRYRLMPAMMYYRTHDSSPINRDGSYSGGRKDNADFGLLGLQLDNFHSSKFFTTLELYGARGGGADGYASFSGGVGYRHPISRRVAWESRATLGLAGDGRIDTGGGLTGQLMTGLSFDLSEHWYLKGMVGRVTALQGALEADVVDIGVGWQANLPVAASGGIFAFDAERFHMLEWRASLGHKSYFPNPSTRNDQGLPYETSQHLIGLQFSHPLNDWISLHGNTHWAYEGEIGSYAEAMFGFSWSPEFMRGDVMGISIDYDIGVGGGGDMQLDDGLIQQLTAGVGFKLKKNLSVELRSGVMQSIGGSYDANLLQLQLSWDLLSAVSK